MYDLQNLLKYFQGDTITILAGPKKQRFLIHQEALKLTGSSSLRTLVDGRWSESKNQIIDWCHTDADTVSRICTFLYTGDYETPHPTSRVDTSPSAVEDKAEADRLSETRLDPTEDAEAEPEVEPDIEPQVEPQVMLEEINIEVVAPAHSDHTGSDTNLQRTLQRSFDARPLTPIDGILPKEVTIGTGANFDITKYPYEQYYYVDTLLAHAKLYAFAYYHSYLTLTNLALQRLIETLNNVRCEEEHAAREVAALADFVYEHVGTEAIDKDPLHKTTSHFVAMNFTSLARDDLERSLALGGDFTLDVIRKVSRRIRADAELVEAVKQENANLHRKFGDLTVTEEQPVDPWGFRSSGQRRGRRH
ncbi:hypothetical protein LTR70_010708 [Exophiala xenobiotica]|uniref:BTB domain-containing protein n=1 Tax=Lithohypha guttulata TaxID=1690604 RepID=A0ABR0JWC5_9EURO|nr:hypothetical protein LTR24_009658 [Lithohypha guttulata]KAK5308961.1 hypothetical protein LTR70_010708 [Exophiala xenobiotica]